MPSTAALITLIVALITYYMIVQWYMNRKKAKVLQLDPTPPAVASIIGRTQPLASAWTPAGQQHAPEDEEDDDFEFIEDDTSLLLREAEQVVEQIQDVITHIASAPPNVEELTSKISAVLSNYTIFKETEYYEAINSFILFAAERDCALQLTRADVEQLWRN